MTHLFSDISSALADIADGWTSDARAHSLAALVVALRPAFSLEIGVYAGKGLVTLGLAHKAIDHGVAIGVDPWSAAESVKGQLSPEDAQWWAKLDHEAVYQKCLQMVQRWGVNGHTQIVRARSDDYEAPEVGLLRIDGNHGEQAFVDAQHFSPKVSLGGVLFLDHIAWSGSHVGRAYDWLLANGWKLLYHLDDGPVLQKVK